eukprot:scaffold13297_cov184-Amphora_coffeaeformis.AAC.1
MLFRQERLFRSLLLLISLQQYVAQPVKRLCSTFKTEFDCSGDVSGENHDCQWCVEANLCTTVEVACPVVGAPGKDDTDPTDIFGGNNNKPPLCNSWSDKESCLTPGNECEWCDDPMGCRPIGSDCPAMDQKEEGGMEGEETNELELDQDNCRRQSGEEACLTDATCIWCPEQSVCRFGGNGCPGSDVENEADIGDIEKCTNITTKKDCSGVESCLWCEASAICRTNTIGCPGANGGEPEEDTERGNICIEIHTSDDCLSTDSCVWCEENEICRSNITGCPGSNGGGSSSENDNESESRANTCIQLFTSEECLASDSCVWCEEKETCHSNSTGCPGPNDRETDNGRANDVACSKLTTSMDCISDESCIWCDEQEMCRSNSTGCTEPGGPTANELGGDSICSKLSASEECLASDSCVWCEDKEMCRSNATGCPGSNGNDDRDNKPSGPSCPSFSAVHECLDSEFGCFWCAAQSKCRKSFADCPGNERLANKRPNVCVSIRNETECETTEIENDNSTSTCVWCAEESLCRADTNECPGQGRGNPCHTYESVEDCESDFICTWFEVAEKCTAARGMAKNTTAGDSDDKRGRTPPACPLLTSLDKCTGEASCRWCPEQELCQKASQSCPNGSLGQRGNPCPKQDSESNCTSIEGCLWCIGLGECKKAVHDAICQETEGDLDDEDSSAGNYTDTGDHLCRRQDAAPECNEQESCHWCEAQFSCRPVETNCTTPSKMVGVELFPIGRDNTTDDDSRQQRGGGSYSYFKIQDQGLGPTDPNAVGIGLSHLYEITESGETIESSLVDLTLQEYQVKQSIGPFFGNNNIQARKISFKANIDNVG